MIRLFKRRLIITLFPLLNGCHLLGDYVPPGETSIVTKTERDICFSIDNPGDYQMVSMSISYRDVPGDPLINLTMPALNIVQKQFCIPPSYFKFPDNGDFYISFRLESPTKVRERRILVTVFRMVDGQPQMLQPRYDELSL